jgi:hypothetical protein
MLDISKHITILIKGEASNILGLDWSYRDKF